MFLSHPRVNLAAMDTLDAQIRRLAAAQHGLLASHQLRGLGISRSWVRHRLAAGELEVVSPRVLRLVGSVATPRHDLMAAVLDAGVGAAASREAAAALWGLPGFWPGPLDVTRLRCSGRRRPGVGDAHETGFLPAHHVSTIDNIPVTSVARTLFDLAGVPGMSDRRLVRAVDNAISMSPPVLPRLHSALVELSRRGRPGVAIMRGLLDERPPGYVAPASGLEARVIELLAESGIATRRQVDLGGEHWIGRVDLLVVGRPLVIECDSGLHHTSLSDRARDARRDEELGRLGFGIVRITDEETFHRPWVVAAKVLERLRAAA